MSDPSGARERGAILPLMAIVLILLMGAAAMAVDLGWVFWNSIEVQHGADAAALAGVVYEPADQTKAYAEARASAAENGYVDGSGGTSITVIDFRDDTASELKENMLRVNITHAVPTFFLTLFGIDSFDVTRTAVAEYLQPLAVGGPESYLGNDPALGRSPGFWAQINGHYVAKIGGDRFASQCLDNGFGSGCTPNPEARPVSGWGSESAQGGYLFGIEVEEGSDVGLKVEIFNGPVYAIPKWDKDNTPAPPLDTWGNPITGNFAGDIKKESGVNVQARTWFHLYGPDLTPLDTTDGNELLCSVYYDERINTSNETNPPISDAYMADFGALGWDTSWLEFEQVTPTILDAMWDNMASATIADFSSGDCSSGFARGKGIYVLRVFNETTANGRGANKFSLRVSSGGPVQPSIYGIGDMVMSSTRNTTKTEFALARVEQQYAGKDLILELWDVGDIEGGVSGDSAWFRIVNGSGDPVDCDWVATSTTDPTNATNGSGPCHINASSRRFNNELITMTVAIPENYTCSGDGCWWRIIYDISGQVKETTTWSAYVAGNPIRLIE